MPAIPLELEDEEEVPMPVELVDVEVLSVPPQA